MLCNSRSVVGARKLLFVNLVDLSALPARYGNGKCKDHPRLSNDIPEGM
jgi:hypothetical protein